MAQWKDSLSLRIRRLETHCIHRGIHKSRSTQGKSFEQQAFRTVEEHSGTLRILTYCAERLAERWDLQTVRRQQAPRISLWQALSIWGKDRTSTKIIMEKTTNGLRYTKHRWVGRRWLFLLQSCVSGQSPDFGILYALPPMGIKHLLQPALSKNKWRNCSICSLPAVSPATTSWSMPTSIWATGSAHLPSSLNPHHAHLCS